MKSFCALSLSLSILSAKITVPLPYGDIEIEDPLVESLIVDPYFQRLKQIHGYGINHYNLDQEEYSRFDHSVGVYYLLKEHHAPYLEQIAGLLHDASHTAFSHFGDYFFKEMGEDSWQNLHHTEILRKGGLEKHLLPYKITLESLDHKSGHFPALEQNLPNLCADRIEYNLEGALKKDLITLEEFKLLTCDLIYHEGLWSFSNPLLAEKLAKACIFMMENCWSCPTQYISNQVLSQLVHRAIDLNALTLEKVCSGTDLEIMSILDSLNDAFIHKGLYLIKHMPEFITDDKEFLYRYKCRAIDPLMRTDGGLKRLSELSLSYQQALEKARSLAKTGRFFSFTNDAKVQFKEYLDDLVATQISSRL